MSMLLESPAFHGFCERALAVLADSAAKGVILLALAWLIVLGMRRSSAAARQLVWALALGGLLLLPALSLVLPKWQLPILPRAPRPAMPAPAVIPAPALTVQPLPLSPQVAEPEAPESATHAPAQPPRPETPMLQETNHGQDARATANHGQDARATVPLGFWVVAVWPLVVLMALVPLCAGLVFLSRLIRRAEPLDQAPWPALLQALSERLCLRRRVRMLRTHGPTMPMAVGVWRPTILLPMEAEAWSEEKRRAVLLHELAHIRRWDCLTHILTRLACVAHWFNPLAWLALKKLQNERERACDDLALSAGARPAAYADQLLEIARTMHTRAMAATAAIPMARKSQLEGRLLAILDGTRRRAGVTSRRMLLALILAGGLLALLTSVQFVSSAASDEDPKNWKIREYHIAVPDSEQIAEIRYSLSAFPMGIGGDWEPYLQLDGQGRVIQVSRFHKPEDFRVQFHTVGGGLTVLLGDRLGTHQGRRLDVSFRNGGTSRTMGTAKPSAKLPPPASAPEGAREFIFPENVRAQLLGVTGDPGSGGVVWAPDGQRLAGLPEGFAGLLIALTPGAGEMVRQFFVRVGLEYDQTVDVIYELTPASWNADVPKKTPGGMRLEIAAALPATTKTARLRLGVASGEWVTLHRWNAGESGTGSGEYGGKRYTVNYGRAFLRNGVAAVTVTDNAFELNTRVLARDSGPLHPSGRDTQTSGSQRQTTFLYQQHKSLGEIHEFEFQVRNYAWHEFDNIALNPSATVKGLSSSGGNDKTTKRLSVPPTFAALLPNGLKVELLGLAHHPGKNQKWWKPDGSPQAVVPEAAQDELKEKKAEGRDPYEIAYRISRMPGLQGDRIEPPDVQFSSGIESSGGGGPSSADPNMLINVAWFSAPSTMKTFDLRLNLSSGLTAFSAETTITLPREKGIDLGSMHMDTPLGQAVITAPVETSNGIIFNVTNNFRDYRRWDIQYGAVDVNGRIHSPRVHRHDRINGASMVELQFAKGVTSLSQLKALRLHARPIETVEFKNISLRPNELTEVQIDVAESPETALNASFPVTSASGQSNSGAGNKIPATPNVEDLQRIYTKKEQSIHTLKVEWEENVEGPLWDKDPDSGGGTLTPNTWGLFAYQGNDMILHRGGRHDDGQMRKMLQFWDGKVYKRFDAQIQHGVMADKPPQFFGTTGESPFDVALIRTRNADGLLMTDLLRFPGVKVGRVKDAQGRELVMIESAVGQGKKIWLDPAKAMLVVKMEAGPYTWQVLEDREVIPGLWLPIHYQRTKKLGDNVAPELRGKVSVLEDYAIKQIEVNTTLPSELFSFEYPAGTNLENQITGKRETVGQTAAKREDQASSHGKTLQLRWVASANDMQQAERLSWFDAKAREPRLWLLKEILLTDQDVAAVVVQPSPAGNDYTVQLRLKDEAKDRFAKLTAQGIGRQLAIVVNGKVVTAPTVRSKISEGKVAINGNFSKQEAEALASAIKSANPAIASAPPGPGFGPVHELVVNHTGENCLIDFDTGRLFSSPTFQQGTDEAIKWMSSHGIDAGGGSQSAVRGLIGMDMIVEPMPNEDWDKTSVQSLLKSEIFKSGKPGNPVFLSAKGELPATYAFKTREGGIGILQILGFIDQEPRGVKIRYRMVMAGPGNNAGATTPTIPIRFLPNESKVSTDSLASDAVYRWRIDTTQTLQVLHSGIHLSADGALVGSWGSGVNRAGDEGPVDLFVQTRIENQNLVLLIGRQTAPGKGGKVTSEKKIPMPEGSRLVTRWRQEPFAMDGTHYVSLWEGRLVRNGKTMETVAVVAAAVPMGDAGFEQSLDLHGRSKDLPIIWLNAIQAGSGTTTTTLNTPAHTARLSQGSPLPELIAALESDDINQWSPATTFLAMRKGEAKSAVPALMRALDHPQKRESALYALREMGAAAADAVPALIRGIGKWADHAAARWGAAVALANIGAAAVPALEHAAQSTHTTVSIWAHAALAHNEVSLPYDPKKGTPSLSIISPYDWYKLVDPNDLPHMHAVGKYLGSPDRNTSSETLEAVKMLGPKAAPLVRMLSEILKLDRPRLPKKDLIEALERIGPAADRSIPEVIKMLDAKDPMTRIGAIRAVKKIDGPTAQAAIPQLIQALQAHDTANAFVAQQQPRIRAEAAEALGTMGAAARPAVPELIKLLNDPDEFVRSNAVQAIGNVDPTNPQALAGLIKAMKDPSVRVSQAANMVLLAVGPVNIDVIRAFIQAVRDNADRFSANGDRRGPPGDMTNASEDFFNQLGPEQRDAVPDLAELARDPHTGVQRLAFQALANIGEVPADLMPALIDRAQKNEDYWAVMALRRLGPKAAPAAHAIIKMLKDGIKQSDGGRIYSAISILDAMGLPAAKGAIPILTRMVQDHINAHFDPGLCESLLKLDSTSIVALDALEKLLVHPKATPTERIYIHSLLYRYGRSPQLHLQALQAALGEKDAELSATAACQILQVCEQPEIRKAALEKIFQILQGPDNSLKDRAAAGFRELGPADAATLPQLVPQLLAILNQPVKTEGDITRHGLREVVEGLGKLGPTAREALPALEMLIQSSREWYEQPLRKAVKEAIRQIRDGNTTMDPGEGNASATADPSVPIGLDQDPVHNLNEAQRIATQARLAATEEAFNLAKARHHAGVVASDEYWKAELEYKVAKAEVEGDLKAAAQARLEYAGKILEQTKKRFDAGLAPRTAVLKAEAELATARTELGGDPKDAAQARLNYTAAEYDRAKSMFYLNVGSKVEVLKAKAEYETAKAALSETTSTATIREKDQSSASTTGKLPQLEVTDFTVTPEGDHFQAAVSVKNTGAAISPAFDIILYPDAVTRKKASFREIGPINPGATWNEAFKSLEFKDGVNRMEVAIDLLGLVKENVRKSHEAVLEVTIKNGKIVNSKAPTTDSGKLNSTMDSGENIKSITTTTTTLQTRGGDAATERDRAEEQSVNGRDDGGGKDDIDRVNRTGKINNQLHYVRIVAGRKKMTFQGRETTTEELPGLLRALPDRPNTVLEFTQAMEVGISSNIRDYEFSNHVEQQARQLAGDLGLYAFEEKIGGPFEAMGSVRFTGPLEFGKMIPCELKIGTVDTSEVLRTEWIKIEWDGGGDGGGIKARIHGSVLLSPITYWTVTLNMYDANGEGRVMCFGNLTQASGPTANLAGKWGAFDLDLANRSDSKQNRQISYYPNAWAALVGSQQAVRFVLTISEAAKPRWVNDTWLQVSPASSGAPQGAISNRTTSDSASSTGAQAAGRARNR